MSKFHAVRTRRWLSATALACSLLVVSAASAQTTAPDARPIRPEWGNINPFYGNINAFWGNINPFYGNINAFWGNINPFYGNINAFWGNINPFYGNINAFAASTSTMDGYLKPTWGNINAFWASLGPTWGNINTSWGSLNANPASTPSDYANLGQQLSSLVDTSRSFWGAAVQSQTGKSFDDAFAKPLLASFGVDLSNPASFAALDENARQHLIVSWYDGLMNYSGADHPDWWMKAVNWTPTLTTELGQGGRATIGILDFTISGDAGVVDNVVQNGGVSTFSNGHGTAVASLMVSPQDGKGIMGIAPMASVVAYNPFDSTGTANWTDVTNGVLMLAKSSATIVNMSLGVPGYTLHQGWNDVFSNADVAKNLGSTVFVIAAGNDGVSQTQNINWNFTANPAIIVVGSVDPTGTISTFSNRPGTACLLDGNTCKTGNQLMNRFIVAPGELILVSDGNGGVTRMSGTSFAAPLVSGTIALLHNRWPWLARYPAETVNIILNSAKDLGAKGVDPVYGVGELDVLAALSPLDYSKLQWFSPTSYSQYAYSSSATTFAQSGAIGAMGLASVSAKVLQQPTQLSKWEANGVYFYAFETDGKTFRDFAIPLSTKLFGQSVKSADGTQQMLQDYLYSRTIDWINAGKFASGFASFSERGGAVPGGGGFSLTMSMAPKTHAYGYRQSAMPYQTAVRLAAPGDVAGFRVGFGDGAVALAGRQGFGLISDYDANAGGANPLLGMASGGAYANADVEVVRGVRASAGFSQRRLVRDPRTMPLNDLAVIGGREDRADAQHFSVAYTPARALTLTASLTRVAEGQAVLGVRSIDASDFGSGAATSGVTLGADLAIGHGFGVALSATQARSVDRGGYRNLTISQGGIRTSAYEVAFAKNRLFGRRDRVRIAFSQPMHVESGSFDYATVQVVDRSTGELGVVTQSFAVPGAPRQYVGEALYGLALAGGMGEVSLFGRMQLRSQAATAATAGTPRLLAGTRFALNF